MKKTIFNSAILLMIWSMLFTACTKEDENENSAYNGIYNGYIFSDSTAIARWTITVDDGDISADESYYIIIDESDDKLSQLKSDEDSYSISGTVDADGTVTANTINAEGNTIDISGTISSTDSAFYATWSGTGGDSGTMTGLIEETSDLDVSIYDGIYSGTHYALEDDVLVEDDSWTFTLNNGVIGNIDEAGVIITGTVNANGSISAMASSASWTWTSHISGSISSSDFSLTATTNSTDGDSGTMVGSKED